MSDTLYHLIIRKGPKPGHIYSLSAPTITIGRDPMSDITLNDPEVSRYHAQLMETEDGYQIQDMGSTNGTYIAGQRLGGDPVALSSGKEIAFGSDIILWFEKVGGSDSDDDLAMATIVDSGYKLEEDMLENPETAVPEMNSQPPFPEYLSDKAPEPSQPLIPGDDETARKKKRNMTMMVAIIVVICCCCIFSVYAMYEWGGDYILGEIERALVTPTITP